MRAPVTFAAITFAAAAALLLTACGNSDTSTGTIKGAQMGSPPSASPSASAGAGPAATAHFALPADIKTIIDADPTGDKNKDAVLQAQANAQLAFLQAAAAMNPQSPALSVYYAGSAKTFYVQEITQAKSQGASITGTFRYYNRRVKSYSDGASVVTYCEDQSKAFSKDAKTGVVHRTDPSPSDYSFYTAVLMKNEIGQWQVDTLNAQDGANECR
ncbi:MAG: hypothetical protein JO362_05255 [Streptomycetaceae bacterium]|nr:hypothetical protein [Streptomycetaceae bacterium]